MPTEEYEVMIMGHIDREEISWAIENNVDFYVADHQRLDDAIQIAQQMGQKARIHIELETGMNRTGFDVKSDPHLFEKIRAHLEFLDIAGICTHLAGAESIANYKRIITQRQRFNYLSKKLQALDWMSPKWHMASSAAAISYKDTKLDMARIGILQYGFFPTQETWVQYLTKQKEVDYPLERVISWKTKVMDVRTVKAGEFVGYGNSFFTNHTTRIAHIPVGYADGYSRSLSNRGKVMIHGVRLDVIGTVNMSMLAVDVTPVEGVEKGDEVVLIGNQGEGEITVSSFGDFSNLLNYELLTRLPNDIPRIISK